MLRQVVRLPCPMTSSDVARGQTVPRWYGPVGGAVMLVAAVALFAGIDAVRSDPPVLAVGVGGIGGFVAALVALVFVHRSVRGEVEVDAQSITARFPSRVVRIAWSEPHELR